MRAITQKTAEAFARNEKVCFSNSQVIINDMGTHYYLHGNLIASMKDGVLFISNCGWKTNTTKERLNGILSQFNLPKISQKHFVWYYGNEVFEGSKLINL